MKVAELRTKYIVWCNGYYVKNGKPTGTAKNIDTMLGRFVLDYGPMAAEDLHAGHFTEWIEGLADLGQFSRGYCNEHLKVVRRMIKWGIARRMIPAAVLAETQAVMLLKRGRSNAPESKEVGPVSFEHVQATIPHLPGRVLRSLVWTLYYCGARSGELVNAKIGDLDQSNPQCWLYSPVEHKTAHRGHDRTIYLGPSCISMIQPLIIGRSPDAYVWCATQARAESIFDAAMIRTSKPTASQRPGTRRSRTDYSSRPYRQPSLTNAVRRACEAGNVPHWHPHQLRHAAGTRIVAEHGVEAGRVMLGHADMRMVARYAAPSIEQGIKVASLIG